MIKLKLGAFFLSVLCFQLFAKALPEAELTHFESNEVIKTADLKGKVVYLDFWASWCIPCKKSFPFMNELNAKYPKDSFKVVAINMDEFKDDAKKFLEQIPADFDVYTDANNILAKNMDIPGLPVAFIINKQGEVVARHVGFNDRKKNKKIQQLDYLMEQP